jgi:SAM-dependent methyltransferase
MIASTVARERAWRGGLRGARRRGSAACAPEMRVPPARVAFRGRRVGPFRSTTTRDNSLRFGVFSLRQECEPSNASDHSYSTGMNKAQASTTSGARATTCPHDICPWYLGYFLASPVRRLLEKPEAILAPYVKPGMTVLEPGCGMGFFSLPLARLVGPGGKVVCVDLQQKMIDGLARRARRARVLDRIETAVCRPDDLGVAAWSDAIDLAVAIHVVHEIPDAGRFLRQIHESLRPGGALVIIEPKGHVTAEQFAKTIALAEAAGFGRDLEAPVAKPLQATLRKR